MNMKVIIPDAESFPGQQAISRELRRLFVVRLSDPVKKIDCSCVSLEERIGIEGITDSVIEINRIIKNEFVKVGFDTAKAVLSEKLRRILGKRPYSWGDALRLRWKTSDSQMIIDALNEAYATDEEKAKPNDGK